MKSEIKAVSQTCNSQFFPFIFGFFPADNYEICFSRSFSFVVLAVVSLDLVLLVTKTNTILKVFGLDELKHLQTYI